MAKSKLKNKLKSKVKSNPKATKAKVAPKAKSSVKNKVVAKSKAKKQTKAKAKTVVKKAVVKPKSSPKMKAVKKAKSTVKTKASTQARSAIKSKSVKSVSGAQKPAAKIELEKFFSPLDDRIFVSLNSAEKRTAGGLYIPDTATTTTGYFEGTVVACGPGHKDKKGRLKPLDVQLGDQILFSEYAGQKMSLQINGQSNEYYVVRESDVLGIKN